MKAFLDQVSTNVYVEDVFYAVASMAVILAALGLCLIDGGLVRRKNVLDTYMQKLVGAVIAGFSFLFIGYAIWDWQYNEAFGVKNALGEAIKSWWLGGSNLTHFAQYLNPAASPTADVFQTFLVFFVTWAMVTVVLIHGAGLERLKPLPFYAMCAITGGLLMPIAGYLFWGSASPLTNNGLHDFPGVYTLYIFVGTWAVVMAWRLGPRKEAFSARGIVPTNLSLVVIGVFLLMFSIPFIVLGSGFIVPGSGYFGISMTTSGFGIIFINTITAFVAGGVSGAALAYKTRNPMWACLGPIAGYIAAATLLDIGFPWKVLIVALFGPLVAYGTYLALRRLRIDEPKIAPLTLGPGIFGAIATGFIAWHTRTGGYLGLTGKYGFQHAQVTPWWQAIGVVASVALAGISALVICLFFEKTSGLRVTEEVEDQGLDVSYWGVSNFGDDDLALRGPNGDGAVSPVAEPLSH